MLKKLILILLTMSMTLLGLDIDVKLAKSKGDRYSILNLESREPFSCYENKADEAPKNSFICEFSSAPKNSFKGFESEFFKVRQIGGGTFRIEVIAKTKAEIFSQNFDPKSPYSKQAGFEKRANKFVITAYEKELKFVTPVKSPRLNFPVSISSDPYVYVKTLDIDGIPINDAGSLQDIAEFNALKKMYAQKDYKSVLAAAEKAEKSFPNSIFFSEYELYRIKSLVAMGGASNNTSAIEIAKSWIKNFPADEKAPEAMLAIMNAYAKNQDFKSADYYFERITSDYAFLEISKQAMIDYGDALKGSKLRRAAELYRRALYETKNIETASIAAFKCADAYLSLGEKDKAKDYYGKILKGNIGFILGDTQKAYSFTTKLANAGIYSQATEVGIELLKKIDAKNENYEQLLAQIGDWATNTGNTDTAKVYYERYLREYGKGRFAHIIEPKLDKINFGKDQNMSVAQLGQIAGKYPKEQLGQKALLRQLKGLVEAKRFDEALALEPKASVLPKDMLGEANGYIVKSEKEVFGAKLAKNECKDALSLLAKNRITPLASEEPKLYDCYVGVGDYAKATALAQKYLANKDPLTKLPWLYRFAKIADKTGKSKDAYGASKDVLALSKVYKKDEYSDMAFNAVPLAAMYKDVNMLTEALSTVEGKFPRDARSLAAYKSAIRYAIGKNDILMNLKYSQKLYELQNAIKVHVETPWIELNYAEVLSKKGDYKQAVTVLESSLNKKMSDTDRARVLFEMSSYLTASKEGDKAKKALAECAKVKGASAWKKLCTEALELNKQ